MALAKVEIYFRYRVPAPELRVASFAVNRHSGASWRLTLGQFSRDRTAA
jgi:hypothetical protein